MESEADLKYFLTLYFLDSQIQNEVYSLKHSHNLLHEASFGHKFHRELVIVSKAAINIAMDEIEVDNFDFHDSFSYVKEKFDDFCVEDRLHSLDMEEQVHKNHIETFLETFPHLIVHNY